MASMFIDGAWTAGSGGSADQADKAGRIVDTGQVNVLGRVVREQIGVCVLITHGGMRRSGNGRELGQTGQARVPAAQACLAQLRRPPMRWFKGGEA